MQITNRPKYKLSHSNLRVKSYLQDVNFKLVRHKSALPLKSFPIWQPVRSTCCRFHFRRFIQDGAILSHGLLDHSLQTDQLYHIHSRIFTQPATITTCTETLKNKKRSCCNKIIITCVCNVHECRGFLLGYLYLYTIKG